MSLVLFHSPVGRVLHSWRRPESRIEDLLSLGWAKYSCQAVEAACFDAVLFADVVFYDPAIFPDPMGGYESITTASAMCAVTEHIGLIATLSTILTQPYNTARMLVQLDFLSNGRAGWNLVTSTSGEQNVGAVQLPKAERYEIAEEFVQVVYKLWDAWDDDALECDRLQGVWSNPTKIHPPKFNGKYFSVRDAMSMPRSPQGRPVIVQAGQSEWGMRLAAQHGEMVFAAKSHLNSAINFCSDVKRLAVEYGRDSSKIRVLPGLVPIVGETEAEAREIEAELGALYNVELGLKDLTDRMMGADLSGLPLDQPIPPERLVSLEDAAKMSAQGGLTDARARWYPNLYQRIVVDRPRLQELLQMTTTRGGGHQVLVGTAISIADEMQRWFEAGACDGFTVIPTYMPEGLDRICESLVPELQNRGLFRTEYPGTTLRDTLGLDRPVPQR